MLIDGWAVHPGGRSILDRVESQVGLSEAQMAPSRRVLREYGNMSSATVLFILREHLKGRGGEGQDVEGRGGAGHAPAPPEARRVCAMAFGPGLTVESALLTRRVGG